MTCYELKLMRKVEREIGTVELKHFKKAVTILENDPRNRTQEQYLEALVSIINKIQACDRR